MSQAKTPSVFDPERILHRRNLRGRQFFHTEIPQFSFEYFPSSSSQVAQVQGSDSAGGETSYYSDSLPLGNIQIKDEAESIDTTRYTFHPTPEAEEVKEVTEISTVNIPPFSSSPQAAVQYIPIVIHTSLPPPPPLTHQTLLLCPPPPPMANVSGFFLNKYAPPGITSSAE